MEEATQRSIPEVTWVNQAIQRFYQTEHFVGTETEFLWRNYVDLSLQVEGLDESLQNIGRPNTMSADASLSKKDTGGDRWYGRGVVHPIVAITIFVSMGSEAGFILFVDRAHVFQC